ncbi:MAG: HEAT repeat domain-containing protein [Dehalococcoidia bacterium]
MTQDHDPPEPDSGDLAADDLDDDDSATIPPADAVIAEIASERPIEYAHLRALANPSDEVVAGIMRIWPQLRPERRREVLAKLQQLGEDHPALDFHRIHLSATRDADVATRILAVRGLWEQERPEFLHLLLRQIRTDDEPSVRAEIADALGRWVITAEFGLLPDEDMEELSAVLRETIEDIEETDEVRGRALEALGAWSDESVAELLSDMYELGNQRLRVAAIRGMGRNASDSWLPILIYHFDDDDPEIRAVAATAAGNLLAEDAVEPLIMLLEDADADVQVAAVRALGEIATEESERVLTRMLHERAEPHLRDAVRDALAEVQLLTMPLSDAATRAPLFEPITGAELDVEDGVEPNEDEEGEF